jgi:hypothetical protein
LNIEKRIAEMQSSFVMSEQIGTAAASSMVAEKRRTVTKRVDNCIQKIKNIL